MPEEKPKNPIEDQIRQASLAPQETRAPETEGGIGEAPSPLQETAAETQPDTQPAEPPLKPAADQPKMSMRDRQKQVKPRVDQQGQKVTPPRLAQDQQAPPEPEQQPQPRRAARGGALKKMASKWAPIAVPMGTGLIGAATSYLIS